MGPFLVTETRYRSGLTTPWHAHQTAAICLVTSGSYAERFARGAFDCTPSTVVFRPADVEHEDVVGPTGAECFIAEPDPEWLAGAGIPASDRSMPLQVARGRASWLMHHVREECRTPDAMSAIAVESLFTAALVDVLRVKSVVASDRRVPPWLIRARETLHEQHTQKLSLAALAAAANVHPVHLASAFRAAFGMPVGEYLRRLRVESARRALHGPLSISRIALDYGFASPSHFARVFAKHLGVSPSAYRNAHRRS